ncbi:MAG: hypothetical protein H6809_05795 [Phycisphaeraceae bacterium]|nr:hypothetical protein [Phycisphaeraceae bacterium]
METDRTNQRGGLSEAGRARKAAMLAGIQREVRARGRRRLAGRLVAVAAPVLAVAIGAAVVWGGPGFSERDAIGPEIAGRGGGDRGDRDQTVTPDAPEAPVLVASSPRDAMRAVDVASWDVVPRVRVAAVSVSRIGNDGTELMARSRVRATADIATIGDDALARALREAGRGEGLVRTPEGVRIVPDRPAEEEGSDGSPASGPAATSGAGRVAA